MAMPSDFILVGAAVAALSPKSHGSILFSWARKYVDAFGAEFLDTAGRCALYCYIVLVCSFFEWLVK